MHLDFTVGWELACWHGRVWPCEVTVQLIRHDSGSCRGPVAPRALPPSWSSQAGPSRTGRSATSTLSSGLPSPGTRPGFSPWKPGCRCELASEQRMEGWAERVSRAEAPGRVLGVTGQKLSCAGTLRVCTPPHRARGPRDLRCSSLSPSPPPPAVPRPELHLASSSLRVSSLKEDDWWSAALGSPWPSTLSSSVFPLKVAKDPLDPFALEQQFEGRPSADI